MKKPNKFSLLVWACNLTLVLISVGIIGACYYYTLIPGLIDVKPVPDGASKWKTSVSHGFLSDYFTFQQVYNKEKGIDRDSYYFSSASNLYMVPFEDSLQVEVYRIYEDLSSTEHSLSNMQIKSMTVSESGIQLPVRFAVPAIPLDREEFKYLARMNVLAFILYGIYIFIFIWFLRKFVSGLGKPNFFNTQNSKYLYITAGLVALAPLLMWVMTAFTRPDLYSKYLIDNKAAINEISSLPLALLVFGVILLVIAWCFDQGIKLQKEQELTI